MWGESRVSRKEHEFNFWVRKAKFVAKCNPPLYFLIPLCADSDPLILS